MPQPLHLRDPGTCRWDMAALGEVMLRFDPGERRVRNARAFDVWEGGGEYNVARALAKGFGQRTTALTALPRNDLGLLASDLMSQGGVDQSHMIWRDSDGIGRNTRLGLNFTERGFGVRPALGVSDRANSAASQIRPEEFDWDVLLGQQGVRWLHTGGIFAALSPTTAETTVAAVQAARDAGTVVSYDLNYRASLWNAHPDPDAARTINRTIAGNVDVMIGDAWGFRACLGLDLDPGTEFGTAAEAFVSAFPQTKIVATTLRGVSSASRNDWSAALWADGRVYQAPVRPDLDILDRVGGGDAFVSGLAFALLQDLGPQAAVDYGAAHGALAMTTPGDSSMVDRAEVEALVAGTGARAIR